MNNDGKKISFSFSKVKKPSLVNKANVEPKDKVDYVDCFDGSKGKFSYKGNVRNDDAPKKELVIPLISNKTSTDIVKSRIEEKSGSKSSKDTESNENRTSNEKKPLANGDNEKASKTLEELAAKEILNDLNSNKNDNKNSSSLIINSNGLEVPKITEPSEADIDYDNIPVSEYGLAMLRGMGWKPNTGIGKEPKMVPTVSPKLRPKGLGLGAQPAAEQKKDEKNNSKEEKTDSKGKKTK